MNASRQSFIVSAVICALLASLFITRYRVAPYPVEAPFEGGMPFAAMLVRFSTTWPILAAACAAIVVLWTLFVVVQLTVRYAPAANRNYLPAQIFLIAAGGIVISGEALAALMAAWLMTLAAKQFIFSFHKGYSFIELFHAGFYMGLIPLLYAPAALFVLPLVVAALMFCRRSGREAVVCLAGLILPIPAAGFIHWATVAPGDFIYRELWRCIAAPSTAELQLPLSVAAAAVLPLILALIGALWALGHKKSIRKTQYKFMQQTSFALFFTAATVFLPGTSTTLAALVAVPCALCLPYAFQGKWAAVSTGIYCLTLVAVMAINLLSVLGIPIP